MEEHLHRDSLNNPNGEGPGQVSRHDRARGGKHCVETSPGNWQLTEKGPGIALISGSKWKAVTVL